MYVYRYVPEPVGLGASGQGLGKLKYSSAAPKFQVRNLARNDFHSYEPMSGVVQNRVHQIAHRRSLAIFHRRRGITGNFRSGKQLCLVFIAEKFPPPPFAGDC